MARTPRKHVIFLGAGASASSGYPVANDLRLRLTSRTELEKHVNLALHGSEQGTVEPAMLALFEKHQQTLDLFRQGGFSSLDEFCGLAQNSMSGTVDELKRLMRFALCLHNPEKEFHQSNYHSLLQGLFLPNKPKLRENISILSFNHDPYLEFLVGRAFDKRWRAFHGGQELPPMTERNAVQSGLLELSQDISKDSGFCILKLHGTVAHPVKETRSDNLTLSHDDLFTAGEGEGQKRLRRIIQCDNAGMEQLQVLFPWEVFNEAREPHCRGNTLWSNVWKRAKAEVTAATKISFVGLSGHPFMEAGFRYLFSEKEGQCTFVTANKENERFSEHFRNGNDLDFSTPGGRIWSTIWLSKSSGAVQPVRSAYDPRPAISPQGDNATPKPAATHYHSFEDFIRSEI